MNLRISVHKSKKNSINKFKKIKVLKEIKFRLIKILMNH